MITTLQGFVFKKSVKTENSVMTMFNGAKKFTVSTVTQEGDKWFLVASDEETAAWEPGSYKYQIVNNEGLEEEGYIKVQANLALANEELSHWRKVLMNIDARLMNQAIDPAHKVKVGDKEIEYLSLDELFALRRFAEQKVAEEDEVPSPSDGRRIIQRCRLR